MFHYYRYSIFVFIFFLTACTFNPLRSDNQLTGNAASTLAGGVIGGGTAALLGASKTGILLSGLGGASIGYYLSTLTFTAGPLTLAGGQVYQVGDYVGIVIPSDNLFDVNTADLLPGATPILDSAKAVIDRYPDHNILISGNTSGFSNHHYEQKISEARAREVAAFFWSRGIQVFKNESFATRKLIYVGYDHYFPISNNIRNKGIRENSRIQITLYPSRLHLKLDKCYKVFNNIGSIEEDEVKPQPPDLIHEFPRDGLPPARIKTGY